MTGSKPAKEIPLRFDFAAAVGEALAHFPVLQKTGLFATSDGEILNQDAMQFLPFPRSSLATLHEDIERSQQVKYSTANVTQGAALMVVYTGEKVTPDALVDKYFSFDHELAHLLKEEARFPRVFPYVESVADAYAALRSIQRFGDRGRDFLAYKAWERASKFVAGDDSTHLTTPVIDKILQDSYATDFSKLTKEETLELAKKYADGFSPDPKAMEAAYQRLGPVRYVHGEKDTAKTALLSSTALASGDAFTIYIGQCVAQEIPAAKQTLKVPVPR